MENSQLQQRFRTTGRMRTKRLANSMKCWQHVLYACGLWKRRVCHFCHICQFQHFRASAARACLTAFVTHYGGRSLVAMLAGLQPPTSAPKGRALKSRVLRRLGWAAAAVGLAGIAYVQVRKALRSRRVKDQLSKWRENGQAEEPIIECQVPVSH
eukprot:6257048-Amphidinium_carterae.2